MIPPDIHDRSPDGHHLHGPPPQETPPGEDGTAGTGPRETYNPVRGWSLVPLALIVLITVLFVLFFLSYAALLL